MLRLALCEKLGMTLSQLRENATKDDILMHAAYFEIQAEDMQKATGQPTPPARRSRRR